MNFFVLIFIVNIYVIVSTDYVSNITLLPNSETKSLYNNDNYYLIFDRNIGKTGELYLIFSIDPKMINVEYAVSKAENSIDIKNVTNNTYKEINYSYPKEGDDKLNKFNFKFYSYLNPNENLENYEIIKISTNNSKTIDQNEITITMKERTIYKLNKEIFDQKFKCEVGNYYFELNDNTKLDYNITIYSSNFFDLLYNSSDYNNINLGKLTYAYKEVSLTDGDEKYYNYFNVPGMNYHTLKVSCFSIVNIKDSEFTGAINLLFIDVKSEQTYTVEDCINGYYYFNNTFTDREKVSLKIETGVSDSIIYISKNKSVEGDYMQLVLDQQLVFEKQTSSGTKSENGNYVYEISIDFPKGYVNLIFAIATNTNGKQVKISYVSNEEEFWTSGVICAVVIAVVIVIGIIVFVILYHFKKKKVTKDIIETRIDNESDIAFTSIVE